MPCRTFIIKVTLSVVYFFNISYSQKKTIMQKGITYKKIPCYMHNSACKWLIIKNAKIF